MFGFLVCAYLIGSVPNAYLFTQWFGKKDIRGVGSKNVGATNVVCNVGWFPGLLTLVADVAKGYLAAFIGTLSSVSIMPSLTSAVAVVGHNWPVWLRFHGGGGLAAFIGSCLRLHGWPLAFGGLTLWGVLYLFCRDHDKSAVIACILLPCILLFLQQSFQTVTFVGTSSFAIMVRRLQSMREKVLSKHQKVQNVA